MIPTLLGAATLAFFIMRIVPCDICEVRFGGVECGVYNKDAVEICREQNHLNKPLTVQFQKFITGIVTFEFGDSMWSRSPISEGLAHRFPLSIQLTVMAMVVSILIGIPLGVLAALRQDTWIDYTARSFSIVGIAVPFWRYDDHCRPDLDPSVLRPTVDAAAPIPTFFDDPRNLSQMIWPALAVGYRSRRRLPAGRARLCLGSCAKTTCARQGKGSSGPSSFDATR